MDNVINSNYTFKGKLVGMRQFTDWGLIDMATGQILIFGSYDQILQLYDCVNKLDQIPATDELRNMVTC